MRAPPILLLAALLPLLPDVAGAQESAARDGAPCAAGAGAGAGADAETVAQGAAAHIVALTGQGQTRPQPVAPWAAAALQQPLAPGADVRTLALSSAALLLADRTQIRMAERSLLRLCDARAAHTRMELPLGRVWARTKGRAVDLQLRTPAAVAAVRGTDWDVEVDAAGRTTLTVLSGRIDVSNAQGSVQVGPSEQATVAPGQAPVKQRLVRPRERVQWVMASILVPSRWPELAQPEPAGADGAWRAQALQALRDGHLDSLRTLVQQRLRAQPQDALAQRLLAETEVAAGALPAAERRLHAVWQQAHDAQAAARSAELLQAQDRADEARAFIAQARAQAPDAVPLLLADADAQRLAGAGAAALALYRRAVQLAQGPAEQAAAHAGLGRALLESGDLHAARAELARAVQLQPDDPDYQARAATADTQALRHGPARQGFAAALQQAGDDYVALAGDGLLALQQGQFERAREQLLKALVIEPRYAQAHIWLAVAEYRLGNLPAALDALARARQADPNDPLPWQVEAMLRNDAGEGEASIAAAREALVRLPYLKSLNPLASDAQGSANLGKALGDFGLEHWARAYAQQSYYPLWAGSHFFMSNRYESDFSRRSELYQGYLADPLALGASERRMPILPATGSEWLAGLSLEQSSRHFKFVGDLGQRGLAVAPVPMAWLVDVENMHFDPRSGSGSYALTSPGLHAAVGLRPTDRLALLLSHAQQWTRYGFPGGLDLGDGTSFDSQARQPARRTDVGGAWRWSADEQTWFKLNWSRYGDEKWLTDSDPLVGPYQERYADAQQGVMLRHTVQHGPLRASLGWERSDVRLHFARAYSLVTGAERTRLRFDVPWAELQYAHGPWTWYAHASWPRLDMRWQSRAYLGSTGEDLRAPAFDSGGHGRRLLPRVGLSYQMGAGRALHAAYIESMYAPAAHTLAPVAVGAIPIDYQYQMPGSVARKLAAQLDWQFDARSFGFASLSRQEVSSAMYSDGSLLSFLSVLVGDRVESLGPLIQTAGTIVDAYNGTPNYDRGELRQAALALNRILTPRWSLLGSYTWMQARNTGSVFAGNALPDFPRHTAVLASVWRHGGRDYSYASLVYRGTRFSDLGNRQVVEPGWTLNLAHSVDLDDRHWSVIGTLTVPLDGRDDPNLWLRARYRF